MADTQASTRRSLDVNKSFKDKDNKQAWLDAWADPVADVKAFSSCVTTCNLLGDGDWRLVVADTDRKLKVWKGTHKALEQALLDDPVAITSFVPEPVTSPRVPSLAVAIGGSIYMFRMLRPYFKFTIPPLPSEEETIWAQASAGTLSPDAASAALASLSAAGVHLAARSLQLLCLSDPGQKADHIASSSSNGAVAAAAESRSAFITCMDTLRVNGNEGDAGVSCLIIGTEDGRVLLLNPAATAVATEVHFSQSNTLTAAVPAFLSVAGSLNEGYMVSVAARDGRVYNIKSGVLGKEVIQLETPAVGVVRIGKHVFVGCMNQKLHCYSSRGGKAYSVYLPSHILTLQLLALNNARGTKCLLLALGNGEVRVYNDKALVSVHQAAAPVTALYFGRYGREDHSLITLTRTGALDIKILPRTANLECGGSGGSGNGPPPEQDTPLPVPKKTKLYIEQTQREREQAVDMHRVFQRDLCKLRLLTARAYVKVLTDGQGSSSISTAAAVQVSLTASVEGLGPAFRLCLALTNEGSSMVRDMQVVLQYDQELYQVSRQQLDVPLLVPMLQYDYQVDVKCLEPEAAADTIRIAMIGAGTSVPYLVAVVQMPMSELDE